MNNVQSLSHTNKSVVKVSMYRFKWFYNHSVLISNDHTFFATHKLTFWTKATVHHPSWSSPQSYAILLFRTLYNTRHTIIPVWCTKHKSNRKTPYYGFKYMYLQLPLLYTLRLFTVISFIIYMWSHCHIFQVNALRFFLEIYKKNCF